ncbi:MAG: hypothetical protein EOP11_17590 [Proteobacteria bacterium]|nr:MAG: hypothetical protein EOP11_17590 [Pseudomonadota bacterium]
MKQFLLLGLLPLAAIAAPKAPATNNLETGRAAIKSMAGCYLVDFSYTETHSLKDGYVRKSDVYDVNKDKSVKEWIYVDEITPQRLRVQHTLFMTGLDGKVNKDTIMKHTGDEWQFNAPFQYDFVGPVHWEPNTEATRNLWTRRITNLDDGLRYSCSAAWSNETPATWGCDSYAPIPGRETRDMQRKDYNTLQRNSTVIAYGNSFLERQINIKTIDKDGVKTPLAREEGKNWWVRLPDSDCADAAAYAKQHKPFWDLTREVWDEVLDGRGSFREQGYKPNAATRYIGFLSLEQDYLGKDLSVASIRNAAKEAFRKVIEEFRVR